MWFNYIDYLHWLIEITNLKHRLDWLRRAMKRVSIAEFVVVGIMLVILILAIFPSFQRAQTVNKVARQRFALGETTNAMLVYNQNSGGSILAKATLYIMKDSEQITLVGWDYKRNHESYYHFRKNTDVRNAYYDNIRLIAPPILLTEIQDENGISRKENRPYLIFSDAYIKVKVLLSRQVSIEEERVTDYASTRSPYYLGITAGPFLSCQNESLSLLPEKDGKGITYRISSSNYETILYDPSNGTLSHGYLIYETTSIVSNQTPTGENDSG